MPSSQTFPLPSGHHHRAHAMPWWMGYTLISPLRRLFENPHTLLAPLVKAGDTVLEAGPGMGYHTLPLAEMVGPQGLVIAVDCQAPMVKRLRRRAAKRHLDARIDARRCSAETLNVADLAGRVDLVLAYNVIHEAPDPERMIGEMARTLRPGGQMILAEPRGHVSRDVFLWEYGVCREVGLVARRWPRLRREMVVVMTKAEPEAPAAGPDDLTPAA